MPCVYFKAVKDASKTSTSGVFGYCLGYSEEKLRIPCLEEYRKYCTAEDQAGCPVFEYRVKEEVRISTKTEPVKK